MRRFAMRHYWPAVAGLLLLAVMLGYWMINRNNDPLQQALHFTQKGEFTKASDALADVEFPDTAVLATRLLLLVGQLGANVQLQTEYDQLFTQAEGQQEVIDAVSSAQTANYERLVIHNEQLQETAQKFAKIYKRGNEISPPWKSGKVNLSINERALDRSLRNLQSGRVRATDVATLEKSLHRISLYHVFQVTMKQEGPVFTMTSPYSLPVLLFYIGARVDSATLKNWYMREVLAIAPADDEMAQQAQAYLDSLG